MKALEIKGLKDIQLVELAKPEPAEGDVLLRVVYVGFCGSDLNTFRGKNALAKSPVIPGHEICARIERVGAGVPGELKPGMLVTADPYTGCGHCASCLNERSNACQHNETLGVQRDGAMREYICLPWKKVIPAEGLDDKTVALIEPMSVGFHAINRSAVTDIDTVMVIGCGMIGMGAIVRGAMRGATVIAVDVDDEKLQLAQAFGAKHVINSKSEDLHQRLADITGGMGPTKVIEAVGSPFTQRQAIEEVSFTGTVVFIGYAPAETTFLTKLFVQKELDIRGSRNAKPSDFRAVIHYLQQTTCPVEKLITKTVKPEEAETALQEWDAAPGKVFRILVGF